MFDDVDHVSNLLKFGAADRSIWELARNGNAVIVSKDDDFRQLAILHGFPPKVIWLRCGNVTTAQIVGMLESNAERIADFLQNDEESVLAIK